MAQILRAREAIASPHAFAIAGTGGSANDGTTPDSAQGRVPQPTGSFKIYDANYRVSTPTGRERDAEVVAYSTGNGPRPWLV
jgi:hypothetical protein